MVTFPRIGASRGPGSGGRRSLAAKTRRDTMAKHFDAAIIGTGQAGPSLANRLSQAGRTVVVFEREHFGGTCVNDGCIPTKTLVASAYAAHLAARGDDYGVVIEGRVRVDMKKVKARKDEVSGTSARNIETWLNGIKH